MYKNKEELYELIKDIKSKEDFEREIKELIKSYGNLIDEDAAALLIVDKLGRNKQHILGIAELKPDMDCTIFGKVERIYPPKTFERENKVGKVVNIDISDNTGKCRLVLWDEDVELVENGVIGVGSIVKVINGYTKTGRNGFLEVNVGRWGSIEVDPEDAPEIIIKESMKEESNDIKGEIIEIKPTKAFFRDNGEFGFVTNIRVRNAAGKEIKLTLWDEKVREIQNFKVGDKILVKKVNIRYNHGEKEFHVTSNSVVLKT